MDHVLRDHPEIARIAEFGKHAILLRIVVPEVVGIIAFTDVPPYADRWTVPESHLDDLASFVSFDLITHALPDGEPDWRARTEALLGLGASIYPASRRALSLIARYNELLANPAEMKDRRILYLSPTCTDLEARSVVFAYIVNEAIDGPKLDTPDLDATVMSDDVGLGPQVAFTLRLWLANVEIDAAKAYRSGLVGPNAL
ncbi:MAG: hypothetical protein M3N49_00445 [Candidatus Eremiobacteraeota bacterium]|nr:hypothetical protein [Candidatus Eremiobacteraeota bacterium]